MEKNTKIKCVVQSDCAGKNHLHICTGCPARVTCQESCADLVGATVKEETIGYFLALNLAPRSREELKGK